MAGSWRATRPARKTASCGAREAHGDAAVARHPDAGTRPRTRPVPAQSGPPADAVLAMQRTAGNHATAAWLSTLQRDPAGTGPPPLELRLPDFEDLVAGPMSPGTVHQSKGLTVTQVNAQHVDIDYGDSHLRLAASPGDV